MSSTTPPKQVALVVGASRGIGRQIAIDLAKNNYIVIVSAKTTSDPTLCTPFPPDPNSPSSTINTVALEITSTGGTATPIAVDTRSPASIQALVTATIALHGRIDILIYNAGAIYWAPVAGTPLSRFLLLERINPQGLYATIQSCLPHFAARGWRARIVVVSPPIYSRFFRGKTAYAMGKVGMSVLTKGLGMDFEKAGWAGMAVTSLWPATGIESAATVTAVAGEEGKRELRKATVFSDAVLAVIRAPVERVNGLLEIDEDFLRREEGVSEFGRYSVVEGAEPRRIMPRVLPRLEVEEQDDEGVRVDSNELREREGKAKL
ncbi:hypothetical protein N7G274_005885 [Stereocaulon virgatum]|uniref:Uncharacterized protein n=1 Tax=Stereocaulon virgatum TaxID=373712 RepID=A0ABR4A741_9LECA